MWLWIIGGFYGLVASALFIGGLWEWRSIHFANTPGESFIIAILWPLWVVMALLERF